jgi:hypothetical protein
VPLLPCSFTIYIPYTHCNGCEPNLAMESSTTECNVSPAEPTDVIKLNVGGVHFTTTRSTLMRRPDCMLGAMFGGQHTSTVDDAGSYFVDNDGSAFHVVLNFLRHDKLIISDVELSRLFPQLVHDAGLLDSHHCAIAGITT